MEAHCSAVLGQAPLSGMMYLYNTDVSNAIWMIQMASLKYMLLVGLPDISIMLAMQDVGGICLAPCSSLQYAGGGLN